MIIAEQDDLQQNYNPMTLMQPFFQLDELFVAPMKIC